MHDEMRVLTPQRGHRDREVLSLVSEHKPTGAPGGATPTRGATWWKSSGSPLFTYRSSSTSVPAGAWIPQVKPVDHTRPGAGVRPRNSISTSLGPDAAVLLKPFIGRTTMSLTFAGPTIRNHLAWLECESLTRSPLGWPQSRVFEIGGRRPPRLPQWEILLTHRNGFRHKPWIYAASWEVEPATALPSAQSAVLHLGVMGVHADVHFPPMAATSTRLSLRIPTSVKSRWQAEARASGLTDFIVRKVEGQRLPPGA